MRFGPVELLIILTIVMVLFGAGRISRLGSELGSAVTNFRKGLSEGTANESTSNPDNV
ncbi:MAG: twin-arginine translocase TatA/TatE family subunit [Chitinophagaceae bacterium]|nr:twin-arginine translocase TatA/TatE family subunit [Anaerolineae bacterium]